MKPVSTLLLVFTLLFTVTTTFAQGPPTPAPELKKLDYFVGTWSMDGDMKPGPMGPGGKSTATEKDAWMDGGFFLNSQTTFGGVMGAGTEVAYMGYDAAKKKYTYDAFNSMGEHEIALGTLDGDTWIWLADEDMGGMKAKGRFTVKTLSPTSYTYKFELSQDGTNWTTVMDGKATKK